MRDSARVAIKRVVVFCPSMLLEGPVEWVDAPGSGDLNSVKRRERE